MKRRIMILGFILSSAAAASLNAQNPAPTPIPRTIRPTTTAERVNNQIARDADTRFRQMQDMDVPLKRDSVNGNVLNDSIQSIYRKPNKDETKILAPSPELLSRYANFLRQSDTGIIKLNADAQCAEDGKVVVVSENCLQYKIPGAGTAYSFRVHSYRIPRLADLILQKDVLKTDGVLQHGIMVSLGDVPLEDVTLQTKGLKFLVDFKPADGKDDLVRIDGELSKGIKADGFVYRLGFYASENATFVLRSIAYKGNMMRSLNGVVYDEFQFDKRKDVLVVFRVVETDAAGNLTILWKELTRSDSPAIKFDKSGEAKDK